MATTGRPSRFGVMLLLFAAVCMAFALGAMSAMAQFGHLNILTIITGTVALVILVLGVLRYIWWPGPDSPAEGA